MKKSFLIYFVSIVLLAAGCSQSSSQQSAVSNQPTPSPSPTVQSSQTLPVGQTQTKQNAGGSDYQPNDIRPWFTETVDGSKYNQPKTQFTVGQNALEVLDATHQIETTDYGSMGKFVTSIDGIKSDSKHFWEFFVNGKPSNVGASSYKLQSGDKIEWKLSVITASGE